MSKTKAKKCSHCGGTGKEPLNKLCSHCKMVFLTTKASRKFCSDKCAKEQRLEDNRAGGKFYHL